MYAFLPFFLMPVGLQDQNTKVASIDEDCCFQVRDSRGRFVRVSR